MSYNGFDQNEFSYTFPGYQDQFSNGQENYYDYDDQDVRVSPSLIPQATIQQEINLGRTGHYYRTRLASFGQMMTIQLLGFNPATGMVNMNVYIPAQRQWVFHQEHNTDLFGLTYLGPTPPSLPGQGGPGGSPRPPWCAYFPWHPWCR
ncbi:hypothetical protein GMB86_05705 [Terrilactibacillus sp. BCM23-1]|uniref:Uncharacterized protein n=1 Tax=Terrilactibacillus tamarindi TaxID=2599694 RepID=A0A6N8CPC7_9BACI|nr:hypothetical protein [Terrilactibacillus tamarindi]MTT31508.1 hypothetical protein [Terrilactibacillus tamarindi]